MDIALCYESVLPSRGGCETYIGDLARRLARDGHAVHLYACRWDPAALPSSMQYHRPRRPLVVVNSRMVQGHFEHFYGIEPESVRVVRSAIDPTRFSAEDR